MTNREVLVNGKSTEKKHQVKP